MEQLKDGQAKLLDQIHMLNNRSMVDQEEESADDKIRMQQELMFYQENIQLRELNLSEKYQELIEIEEVINRLQNMQEQQRKRMAIQQLQMKRLREMRGMKFMGPMRGRTMHSRALNYTGFSHDTKDLTIMGSVPEP